MSSDSEINTDFENPFRKRKGQSEEEYELQKQQYKDGPTIQEDDSFLLNKDFTKTESNKIDIGYLKNAAERAYYLRDYKRAISILDQTNQWSVINPRDLKEFDAIRHACENKLKNIP